MSIKDRNFRLGPNYPGGLIKNKTGHWRVFTPVIDLTKCKNCLLCWIYCPDGAIKQSDPGLTIDYDYCKGCGICAAECPAKSIMMERR